MGTSIPFPDTKERTGKARTAKRNKWRWWVIGLILLIVGGGVFWWMRSRSASETPTTSTVTVSQGTMTSTVSGSGTVAAARTVELPFQQDGTVTTVSVQIGDVVTTGQELAKMDASDLELDLQQAEASLKSAQANLINVQGGGATDQDIANAKATLASAQANLTKTKTSTTTDLQSAQASLTSAQAKLDALKNPSQADISAAQSKVDTAKSSLESTRTSASQSKTNAQISMENAVNSLTQAQTSYATAKSNWDHVQSDNTDPTNPTTTDSSGNSSKNTLNDAERQQYYSAYVQAQASLSSAENSVKEAQVAYDAARQNEVVEVQQAEQSVKDAETELDALMNPTASDIKQAQASVVQAQASLDALRKGGTAASLASAEASVVQAQSSLDELTLPGSDAELASAEASVVQAQANVATAQNAIEKATLTAPFDGVVSAVNVQPGNTASPDTAAITIVDRSTLHIEVSLSESDAVKVQVGQPVTITFDALSDVTLQGKVATISPAAETSSNVVTYPVQVEFDPGETAVMVGMSATAEIQVEEAKDALIVPSRAITTSGTKKTVKLMQGGGPQGGATIEVPVTTGITSSGQTQIVSSGDEKTPSLKAGDTLVVASTTTTSATTTTTTNRNNGGGMGGFGGGMGGPPGP